MADLAPFQTCLDLTEGDPLPLPEKLAGVYGTLRVRKPAGRPLVIANFVTTLDGVISLKLPGLAGGEPISGGNAHDAMVMGLLRAVADVAIIGAGSLRAGPNSRVTAEYVFPPLAEEFRALRAALGRPPSPLNVVVTARGAVDRQHPIFTSGEVRVLVLSTDLGLAELRRHDWPEWVTLESIGAGDSLDPAAILQAAMAHQSPCEIVLSEGGPGLTGDLLAANLLDELFLTLAPQIAGRHQSERPGLAAGHEFAPHDSRWGELTSVKRAGHHLFLRYSFRRPE